MELAIFVTMLQVTSLVTKCFNRRPLSRFVVGDGVATEKRRPVPDRRDHQCCRTVVFYDNRLAQAVS